MLCGREGESVTERGREGERERERESFVPPILLCGAVPFLKILSPPVVTCVL